MRTHSTLLFLAFLAWTGNALYAVSPSGGVGKDVSSGIAAFSMLAFLVLHSRRLYAPGLILAFFIVTGVITWLVETWGMATGLPFGRYQYNEIMAPFLGSVPVSVLFAYAMVGYLAWSMARIYVGALTPIGRRADLLLTPILAALFMVIWDVSMDPLRASYEGRWTWLDGGVYFGVPALNFLGWFIVTWMFFQVFALISAGTPRTGGAQEDWAVPIMYAAFAGEYLLNPFLGSDPDRLIEINGHLGVLGDLYNSIALVCMFSMIPVAFGGLVILRFGTSKVFERRMLPSKSSTIRANSRRGGKGTGS